LSKAVAAVFVLTGAAVAAAAQPSAMPADIVWKPIEIRNVVDYPKTADDYARLQEKEPYQAIKVERDVKYGPAERNLLDVFTSEMDSKAQPVLIFIHGGAFIAGDKQSAGSPFYDNIALWAARHGFIGVTMTYRLAPQSPWPAGAEDIALAVKWVAGNRLSDLALRFLARCPLLALRVISRARNNQVAFGEKRTSAGRQNPLTWSQMTHKQTS
jgi:acetyl esterase/lipase